MMGLDVENSRVMCTGGTGSGGGGGGRGALFTVRAFWNCDRII